MFGVFMLHVLITCLDAIFIKSRDYTCTTSELHLINIFTCFIVLVYSLHVLV